MGLPRIDLICIDDVLPLETPPSHDRLPPGKLRIEDVKVGDKVILRAWATNLPGVRRITAEKLAACGKIAVIQGMDFSDNTISLLFGEHGVMWWPVGYCELYTC